MSLEADFTVRRGELELTVAISAPAGEVTAVLGPNGSGKSTLLDCIAGTVAIDGGSIVLGGVVLDQPPKTFLAQRSRRVGAVHQELLLFPHMRVLDNVAFGPRSRGLPANVARRRAHEWLVKVGAGELEARRPGELSGGQAQRVALARALATEPHALLLDEPLSALDAGTRLEVRRELRRHLDGYEGATVLVTHDPLDVLALADRVAILENGRLSQAGSVAEVTRRPRSRYVADLIGTNLLNGTASGATVTVEGGARLSTAEAHHGPVFLTIDPAAIALHRIEPEGSPRNRWHTTVAHLEVLGDRVRVQLAAPVPVVAEVTADAVAELGLHQGSSVWASAKATEVAAYPR